MIILRVSAPYASFRKSFARSFAESYPLPPPATVYGMLLSLVGERFRQRHAGVRFALAYKCRRYEERRCGFPCLPHVATTLRKLSRFKYGVAQGEKLKTLKPDFIETLCEIEFLCWLDSTQEQAHAATTSDDEARTLEERVVEALLEPEKVTRYGVLSLGLSDDAVNEITLCTQVRGTWHRLLPSDAGTIELPVWVDHVGAANTRWQRYRLEPEAIKPDNEPGRNDWSWTEILDPRR